MLELGITGVRETKQKKKRREMMLYMNKRAKQTIEGGHFFPPVHFKGIVREVREKWRVTIRYEN